ncbi:hypothetical protein NG819_17300 [Pseudarthrobacter sp. Fe7]|nr:hypothetical protein NG819_17300 [Pseudarthrobacter sp. Fe7]
MTELIEPDHASAQPAPEWPQAAGQDITDPQVAQAIARLRDLPGLPAADHETVYNEAPRRSAGRPQQRHRGQPSHEQ